MTFYYATFGLLLALRAFFADRRGRTNQVYWLVLVSLFLFSGFRWEVGCDWTGYAFHFVERPNESLLETLSKREAGYWLLVRILVGFGLPYWTLNVATSALFFAGLHVLARRQSDPLGFLVLAFPILIINMPMSGIRQAAAMGFFCIALTSIIDRKPVGFLIWIGIASLFHASALAFAPLVAFVYGGFTSRNLMVGTLLAIPGVILLGSTDAAEVAISRYVATENVSFGAQYRLGLLAITGLAFFMFVFRTWRQKFPYDHWIVSIGAVLMILAGLMIPFSSTIADRLGYYLIPIQLIIFARLPLLFAGQTRDVFTWAPYLLLGFVFVVWSQVSLHFQICYLPYASVLWRW